MATTVRHRSRAAVPLLWLWSGAVVLAGCSAVPPNGPGVTSSARPITPAPSAGTAGQGGSIAEQIGQWDPQASVVAATIAGLALLAAVLNFLRFVYTNRLDVFHLALVLSLVCIAATIGFALYYIHA
jgi:hypothetical protein